MQPITIPLDLGPAKALAKALLAATDRHHHYDYMRAPVLALRSGTWWLEATTGNWLLAVTSNEIDRVGREHNGAPVLALDVPALSRLACVAERHLRPSDLEIPVTACLHWPDVSQVIPVESAEPARPAFFRPALLAEVSSAVHRVASALDPGRRDYSFRVQLGAALHDAARMSYGGSDNGLRVLGVFMPCRED